jgi:hypothetical protein
MSQFRQIIATAFIFFSAFVVPVFAQGVPAVTITSPSGTVTFTRDQLETMGLVSIKTATPWNSGIVNFEGVPLALLLDKANAKGATATVSALNDYSVDVPTADFAQFGVILAVKRNGSYMPVDDQGPFFVMYPFDSNATLRGQPFYGRAVWQVKAIAVQ